MPAFLIQHRPLLAIVFSIIAPAVSCAAQLVIDDFSYSNSVSARSVWTTAGNAPPVSMAASGPWGMDQAMVLPCDFATRQVRCYWDRKASLNLASFTDLALELYAPDPGAISAFTLYFRSGAGWYGCSASVTLAGWQTLHFSSNDFTSEGTPSGWNRITGIRLSPWKGGARNTELAVRQLRAFTPSILLLRDTQSDDPATVTSTIDRHLEFLGQYNIPCGVITRAGVESGLLDGCKVAILPYNSNLSNAEWDRLESFIANGGKMIVYYLLPARMEPLLGVKRTGWKQGDFAAMSFADPSIQGLPARVRQSSWNITLAIPNGSLNSRVIAGWDDSQGKPTGHAAWLASDHGFFMSHILLDDDADEKAYLLLCLLGHLVPELWPASAVNAIDQIGQFAGFSSYAEANSAIERQGKDTLRSPQATIELANAASDRNQALAQLAAGNHVLAVMKAHSAQAHLKQAYVQSQKPINPEFRALWEHHPTGAFPGNWAASIDALTNNGFNAIFPNMLWGGLAHYPSDCLPRSFTFTNYGDQIDACITAARARGVQVHIWKVNWNLSGSPSSFISQLRIAGRTQVSRDGQSIDWLCPSDPENFALETNSLLEVVRRYDIDGIHLDYIRYPGSDCCYCPGCASRFQTQTGRTVAHWPADVLSPGPARTAFLDWRRAQITRLVAAIYARTKALKPGVKVSAAVFSDAASAFDGVGQDWRAWIEAGIVDFLCPMNYTTDLHRFTNLVSQQLGFAAGRIPIYPGIGAHALESDGVIAQLQATRQAQTGGFILFELSSSTVAELLPAIRSGATAPDEPDIDGDLLPDAWELRWFSNINQAWPSDDPDGDGASNRREYITGTDPTQPSPDLALAIHTVNGDIEVTFQRRATDAPGYQNAKRHYRIETTGAFDLSGPWIPVPGLSDQAAVADVNTVKFSVTPAEQETRFYRVRVWLQQP